MAKLETTYLGLKLKNPVIVGSSGLTISLDKIRKFEEAGAGAVVLKSLFEEQITHEIDHAIYQGAGMDYPEAVDYVKNYARNHRVSEYLELIRQAKAETNIPIIASINCYSSDEWTDFAQQIERAGADALELNLFIINTDKNSNASTYEDVYYRIASTVTQVVSIPVSMKLGYYFSNLVAVVDKLSVCGAKGVVLFNRFYEPDIDVNNLTITTANVLSSSSDISRSLRWTAIVSDKVRNIDISASTGVHDGDSVIKLLLAGATTVQVCSALYQKGPELITEMIGRLQAWMDAKGFDSIERFRGLMSYAKMLNPAVYERVQFMKHFSKYE